MLIALHTGDNEVASNYVLLLLPLLLVLIVFRGRGGSSPPAAPWQMSLQVTSPPGIFSCQLGAQPPLRGF